MGRLFSISETMQAVQLDGYGMPLTVRRIPTPRPGQGEILVRMAASPVNPSDLVSIRRAGSRSLPFVPGIEGSGTVVAAGPGLLPRFYLGKRVGCAASPARNGAWSEYMQVNARRCFILSNRLTLEQGAMLLVNPLTALAFFDIARQGKHAAMVNNAAASALGKMILSMSHKTGIPVIHVVRRQEQVDMLLALGAEYVLNSSESSFTDKLNALAHQLKATLFLDVVAGGQTQLFLEAAPFGSTVIVYGFLSGEACSIQPSTLLGQQKTVQGFYLANWMAKKSLLKVLSDTQRVQRLAQDELSTFVQRRFPLVEINQALEKYVNNMTAGKVLLVANPQEVKLD